MEQAGFIFLPFVLAQNLFKQYFLIVGCTHALTKICR